MSDQTDKRKFRKNFQRGVGITPQGARERLAAFDQRLYEQTTSKRAEETITFDDGNPNGDNSPKVSVSAPASKSTTGFMHAQYGNDPLARGGAGTASGEQKTIIIDDNGMLNYYIIPATLAGEVT
jgi:hypothetical protein